FPHYDFASAVMVRIGRIDVVHARIDGASNHDDCLHFVNITAHAVSSRQAHAAETQGRGLPIQSTERSVLHMMPPFADSDYIRSFPSLQAIFRTTCCSRVSRDMV